MDRLAGSTAPPARPCGGVMAGLAGGVLLRRLRAAVSARAVLPLAAGLALAVAVVAVAGLVRTTDRALLAQAGRAGIDRPVEAVAVSACFVGAFAVRAWLWGRLVPCLRYGHALSAVLVSVAGNHVLPFRLGESLRVASVVRRAGLPADDAVTSTVALRVGDLLVLVAIGLVVAPSVAVAALGAWGWLVIGALIGLGAWSLRRILRGIRAGRLRRPGGVAFAGTALAWLLEAVLVWRVANWTGAAIGYREAVVVTAVAVTSQVVAIAPGGIGSYEAAASGAMAVAGVPLTTAVSAAVAVHLAKTALSLLAGAVALCVPAPPLFGRWRVERRRSAPRAGGVPPGDVVLFLPAHDEAPRIGAVLARVPASVGGRAVRVLVVDDGSTDATAATARRAGATVVSHPTNRGLGAAVETGLREAVAGGAAVVAFCDADGEYDPAELERLVTPILDGTADYVVGSRFRGTIEHMRRHRRLGNRVLSGWVAWMARLPITDGQSGYRALSRAAAGQTVSGHDYNYAQVLTLDLAQRGFRYHEVPISYCSRRSGRSFVRLGQYVRRCVPAAWRVLNRPVAA